jgi:glycosyltransferase involved in cell wall biosynthesis
MIIKTKAEDQAQSVSLCVCTMNRSDDLQRCLDSVFQADSQPQEIIVSDDSPDGSLTQAVVAKYPGVIYQPGPRRGLGPNRNACIRRATGSHILFIDDDVCVPPDCFSVAQQAIATAAPQVIITGYEMNHATGTARQVTPHNPDFWGFQHMPITDCYRSLVINSTLFPRQLFERIQFDERLRYGCDEIDVARHAKALGYSICYNDQFYVHHYPSSVNREHYRRFVDASRLYSTAKAYWQYERSLPKTLAYLVLAPLHLLGSALKKRQPIEVWRALQAIQLASSYLLTRPEMGQRG